MCLSVAVAWLCWRGASWCESVTDELSQSYFNSNLHMHLTCRDCFAQFIGTVVQPSPMPKLVGSVAFMQAIPRTIPALTYPGGYSLDQLRQWNLTQRGAVNDLWDSSQFQFRELRRKSRDGNKLRAVSKWLQELRIITIRWIREIDETYARLVAAAGQILNCCLLPHPKPAADLLGSSLPSYATLCLE